MAVFHNNPHVDRVRTARFWSNPAAFLLYFLKPAKFYDSMYSTMLPSFFRNKNAKEIIANKFGVKLKDQNVQVFLTGKEEQWAKELLSSFKNPIIIHVTSRFSRNQEWLPERWEELIRSLPEYTFIQLGNPDEMALQHAVDLKGKTSFREALALLKHAKGFVGVVSSFSHATNAFGTPGVVLFGASAPQVWGQPNNINLSKDLRCAPCVDLLTGHACPYDRRCLKEIRVEEVRAALLSLVAEKAPGCGSGQPVVTYPDTLS